MRTIRRIAALVGVAATGLAHAQSSVTLYGVIDVGPTFVSNEGGAHNFKMDDAIASGDRWGLKGTEDLGGGLKSIFDTANYAMSAWASGYATHQGDLDRMGWERLDNVIKFKSADFSGLQVGALYSFGNVAGSLHEDSSWSFGGQYNHGAFSAGAVYLRMNNPNGSNTIDPYASMGVFSFLGQTTAVRNPTTGQVTDLYATTPLQIDSQSVMTLGGSYVYKNVTYGLAYSDVWFKGFGETAVLRTYDSGASWQVTPTFSISGAYFYSSFEGQHYNEASLGFDYNFSKNTDVYLQGSYLRTSAGVDAVQGYLFTPSTTNTQTSVRIGLRHRF